MSTIEQNRADAKQVAAIRRFNRFYTQRIGALRRGIYDSPYGLTEVRVLYEISQRRNPTATELRRELGLNAGYMSRILHGFEAQGWIRKKRAHSDGRQMLLSLTKLGESVLKPMNAIADKEAASLLTGLVNAQRRQLLKAMQVILRLLDPTV